jgi:Protein of unknown function (Hypoth_ymh)
MRIIDLYCSSLSGQNPASPRLAASSVRSCVPYLLCSTCRGKAGCLWCWVSFGAMDRDEAFRHLTDYWAMVGQAQREPPLSRERRAAVKALNQRLMTVNRVLRSLGPDLALIQARSLREHVAGWPRLFRGLGLLGGWQEMTVLQWTAGGPALPLKLLDSVVSEVALPLWEAGKYRQAVSDAATNLNIYAQNRIGRHDISDKDLMGQAFSDKDPELGKSRLRCPGNPANETVKAQQEGARAIAIGVFQAIRNPAHHLPGDWNPITAFHHLVMLSQVAHWFRDWEVVWYVQPMPDLSTIIEAPDNPALTQLIKTMTRTQALSPPADPG